MIKPLILFALATTSSFSAYSAQVNCSDNKGFVATVQFNSKSNQAYYLAGSSEESLDATGSVKGSDMSQALTQGKGGIKWDGQEFRFALRTTLGELIQVSTARFDSNGQSVGRILDGKGNGGLSILCRWVD